MKLKLKQLASIAEIVGALAVVVSLIYVGIEVNDSASAVRSAAANDANVALQAWYLEVGGSPQTSELVYTGVMSEQSLPDADEFQFLMIMHSFFLGLQNSYLLAEEGTIDEELRSTLRTATAGIDTLPGMRRYWRQRKSYLHPGFVEWVERIDDPVEITVDLYKPAQGDPTDR